MKIILLDDIKKLGNKFDVKEVANGYARNFLLPKKLAKLADKVSLAEIDRQRELETKRREKENALMAEVAKQLDNKKFELSMKVGEDGTLYGSISAAQITTLLKKEGFDVSKDQVVLGKPIKGEGEHNVMIKFSNNLEAKITIVVTKETKKK